MVTQQQLDEGKLTYMLSYNDVDASGNVVVKSLSASAALTFTGTAPRLTVNRHHRSRGGTQRQDRHRAV